MSTKLDHHHRHTVERVFAHPIGHNIQWHDVVCLLERCGTMHESHRGAWVFSAPGITVSFGRNRGRDLTEDQVMRVRHLLQTLNVVARTQSTAA